MNDQLAEVISAWLTAWDAWDGADRQRQEFLKACWDLHNAATRLPEFES